MRLTARLGPFSSIVGRSIVVSDETGAVLLLLPILMPNAPPCEDCREQYRELSEKHGQRIVDAINSSQKEHT